MRLMVEGTSKGRAIDNLYPLPKERALLVDERKVGLVIADLHLGIEAELAKGGVHVRSRTHERMNHILDLVAENDADFVILLGDIKHNIPGASEQEFEELPEFLDELLDAAGEVHILKGNHDGGIESIVPEGVHVHEPEGFAWDGLGLFHGHSWPSEKVMRSNVVLMAHIHPTVKFFDGVFSLVSEACWLRGKWTKAALEKYKKPNLDADVIVMPAYNELTGGGAVNEPHRRMIGPVISNGVFDLDRARVHLLDGTYLGDVRSLTRLLEEAYGEEDHGRYRKRRSFGRPDLRFSEEE